jgi:hypothetical protein
MKQAETQKNKRTERHHGRHVEASDYAAFILRVLAGLGDRIADDPAMLAHVPEIQKAITDNVNRGIFVAKNKDWQPYSLAEMGRIYGCSYQNMQQRAKRGETAHVEQQARRAGGALIRIADLRTTRAARLAAADVTDITGSARERDALKATGTDNERRLFS